ncbi:MAG TPA: purine-nucleoside phosphorylase, partial [Clostridiales bacterium]|nr:purine-nucleoside phosphorylase [Clostridiales bacterium]
DSNSENKSSRFLWAKMGVLAVEMESAALYMNAARAGKRALSVLTVSDSLITGESLSSNERQSSFSNMITLALKTAKLLV